jgi:excisionase family DNA binding protein
MQVEGDHPPEVLTLEEAADLLKLRASTVEDYARRGDLPFVFLGNGRNRRFLRSELEEWVLSKSAYRDGRSG